MRYARDALAPGVLLALLAAAAPAQVFGPVSDVPLSERVARADVVVLAEVAAVDRVDDGHPVENGELFFGDTLLSLRVRRVLAGGIEPGACVKLRQFSGVVCPAKRSGLELGDRALFFLARPNTGMLGDGLGVVHDPLEPWQLVSSGQAWRLVLDERTEDAYAARVAEWRALSAEPDAARRQALRRAWLLRLAEDPATRLEAARELAREPSLRAVAQARGPGCPDGRHVDASFPPLRDPPFEPALFTPDERAQLATWLGDAWAGGSPRR